LRVITRNKLTDYRRRRPRLPDAVGGSEHLRRVEHWTRPNNSDASILDRDDEEDEVALSKEASIGRRALEFIRNEFEERSWRAFWRTAIDGQKANDVAVELEMTPAAVRKAKSRVLARLRSELEELVDFE
jgi:RNA polymerase sigma-70 factor (ECF subfamily)